jgi:predicted house-cleaning noncanonical NTP pyrophosphatase (MazG superfamily)
MRVTHNKLIRDRIPEIIEADGHHAATLDGPAYHAALLAKLVEEAKEAQSASRADLPSELADIWEVIQALLRTLPMTSLELEALAATKRSERGGFANKIFLEYTEQTTRALDPSAARQAFCTFGAPGSAWHVERTSSPMRSLLWSKSVAEMVGSFSAIPSYGLASRCRAGVKGGACAA